MADDRNNGTRGSTLVTATGSAVLRFWDGVRNFGAYVYSIFQSFKSLRFIRMRAINTIILSQTGYTGIDALPFVIVIAMLLGGVVIIQGMTNLPKFGIEGYFGNLLVIIIARELGPLVTALIVISRSGTAMATETATQQWSREILSLEISGIDPRLYIVIPRIAASILSIFSLIIFFDIVAFLGGYFISLTTIFIPLDVFFQNLVLSFSLKDLAATILKSLCFGLLIPLISCYYGMMPRSKFEIPIFVSRAVSRTLFFVVLLNAAISVAFYFTWLE
jgi:phospholipid/cholesterol/gamma-HCH transport system permease protein